MASEFGDLKSIHEELLARLAARQDPARDRVNELINSAMSLSANISYIEDREELRSVLRFWGSYLASLGEAFPDVDIDAPGFRPESISSKPIEKSVLDGMTEVLKTGDVLTFVLAGGRGTRLHPLTRNTAKPFLPFGGSHRIIDFSLSNSLNSGLRKILVVTQYKSQGLSQHIDKGWRRFFVRELNEFIEVVPPQQRVDDRWYEGTADAVYQNVYSIEEENPNQVLIVPGDHVYKMNYRPMIEYHKSVGADVTICALRVSAEDARQFGVLQIDESHQLVGFEAKPNQPNTIPGDDQHCLVSIGLCLFEKEVLLELLLDDAVNKHSVHDFGRDIIPSMIDTNRVFVFPFHDENIKSDAYWRDVGTLDSYYQANMECLSVDPLLNMYDKSWPIRTAQPDNLPARFIFDSQLHSRRGEAHDSIVCHGAMIAGLVKRSIVGADAHIGSFAQVEDSILFDGVSIGNGVRIRRAIIEGKMDIPEGLEIGFDHDQDRARGFTVSEGGVTIVTRDDGFVPSDLRVSPASPQPSAA